VVALVVGHPPEVVQRPRDRPPVARRPLVRRVRLVQRVRRLQVAPPRPESAEEEQGAAAPAFGHRLARVDLFSGSVAHRHPVGSGTTAVMSLALGGDAAGPVAYLGLWDRSVASGRVLALRADTGAPLAVVQRWLSWSAGR
jgi:hypothetical protein